MKFTYKSSAEIYADFEALRVAWFAQVPDAVISRMVASWTQLFGTVSFELFGHLNNVIHDYDAFFDLQMRNVAVFLMSDDKSTGA